MKDSLTNRQIAFALFTSMIGYNILNIPNEITRTGGTGSWIYVLIMTIPQMLITYLIIKLNLSQEGKTVTEYSYDISGNFIGNIIFIICFIYVFGRFYILNKLFAETLKLVVLYQTPIWAISLLLIIVVMYALIHGLRTIARLSEIYIPSAIFVYLFVYFLMFTQGNLTNMRPFFPKHDLMTHIKALGDMIRPTLGIEILLFLPLTKKTNKGVIKYGLFTVLLVNLFYILTLEATLSVIGIESLAIFRGSLFKMLRGLDIPFLEFFRRLDGLYIMFWVLQIFVDISIMGYVTTSVLNKKFTKVNKNKMIFITLLTTLVFIQFPKKMESVFVIRDIWSYMGLFMKIIIPIYLLTMNKVKKNG